MTASILILASIVRIIHFAVVLFMIIVPFTDSIGLHVVHISSAISLLVHWSANSDACSLTLMEAALRGVDTGDTFISSIVSPIYKLPDHIISRITYYITILLMLISIYKLYNSKEFTEAFKKLIRGERPLAQMEKMLSP